MTLLRVSINYSGPAEVGGVLAQLPLLQGLYLVDRTAGDVSLNDFLPLLTVLRRLTSLMLSCPGAKLTSEIPNTGLGVLAFLPHLERLDMPDVELDASGLLCLAGHTQFRSLGLSLSNLQIKNLIDLEPTVMCLAALSNLERLTLHGHMREKRDVVQQLQGALPNCTIRYEWY